MNGGHLAPTPPKVKFFIYGVILLKFETDHFHMFKNIIFKWGFLAPPPSTLKVKFLTYGAILLKFETEQFYM